MAAKNVEIQAEKERAEQTADDLRKTQEQLIAKEKLAALGKLTSGVAHELRNPLNFVINFSSELGEQFQELKNSLSGQNSDIEKHLDQLTGYVSKIESHSERADNIITKMLQHSSVQSDHFEETDLVDLVKENLKVALHHVVGKNPELEIRINGPESEEPIPVNLKVVALSRALLNVFDNALYALYEKQERQPGVHPELSIDASIKGNVALLVIHDNGVGMEPHVIQQIFDPFFTTKPTGKGNTGLGMSIAYEIIAKEHGGEIEVFSEAGVYSEVRVLLPLVQRET